ncbi:MAG: terpene cyclase/mutase family protein [Planctomycetes bacterium]|nr:terpene cyclase/mutase family protein [Planctomycetota bacterium]
MNRRTFLTRGAGAALGLSAGSMIWRTLAQEQNPSAGMIDRNTQQAIDGSLRWLADRQRNDGAFGTGQYQGNVAVTALAGLAFMSAGNQPGRGRYGEHVTNAVRYLVRCEEGQNGFITRGGLHGPMYGHGFATLFLAEVYGMVNDTELRDRLRATLGRAVRLIITAQNQEGGWRYSPQPRDADLSVTICQINALRAARNAGIAVPKSVADRCTNYVKACQDDRTGGFRYQARGFGGAGFARTAAGVVALYSAGIYEDQSVKRGLEYLKQFQPGPNRPGGLLNAEAQMHYYYGHYYAVQAMWIAGGNYWREWFPAIRNELLTLRRPDGSWQQGFMCPHYCTAMALIILQVPNNYLPILQR